MNICFFTISFTIKFFVTTNTNSLVMLLIYYRTCEVWNLTRRTNSYNLSIRYLFKIKCKIILKE